MGDPLIAGRVDQNGDWLAGYRVGWDFDHYWGTEGRFGFAYPGLKYDQDPALVRTGRDLFWDVHLLHYPWGDARWRPYGSIGIGMACFRFRDDRHGRLNEALFHLPIGVGMKYYYDKHLVLRFDVMDNMAFGSGGLDTMHNISLTGGVELRCGGRRMSYYPWNPGIHQW